MIIDHCLATRWSWTLWGRKVLIFLCHVVVTSWLQHDQWVQLVGKSYFGSEDEFNLNKWIKKNFERKFAETFGCSLVRLDWYVYEVTTAAGIILLFCLSPMLTGAVGYSRLTTFSNPKKKIEIRPDTVMFHPSRYFNSLGYACSIQISCIVVSPLLYS